MTKSLDSIRSGYASYELVVCIDGYPHLLSNAPQAAVQAAWADTDFATTSVIGGLVVELENAQELNPWDPLMGGGTCTLKVQPDDADVFGIDLHRTDAGAESMLTETAQRDDVTIAGASLTDFAAAGEANIGIERFKYSAKSGNSFTVTARGKYVAMGADGTSPPQFAEHHRVADADNGVALAPLVTEVYRSWTGRRVSVWWHTWDESTQTLNSKADALCIWAGTVSEPLDDGESGHTHVLCEHVLDYVKNAGIGRDQWHGELDYGFDVKVGMVFSFRDQNATGEHIAQDLVVVPAGTASTPNEVNEGQYGADEIASFLNTWLNNETGNNRIAGSYTIATPEDVHGEPRTVVHFFIGGGGSVSWRIKWPHIYFGRILGFPTQLEYAHSDSSAGHAWVLPHAPYTESDVFVPYPQAGGFRAKISSYTGTMFGQYATLPAATKALVPSTQTGEDWGIFVLEGEESRLLLGYIDGDTLFCYPLAKNFAEFLPSDELNSLFVRTGGGAPKLRQIFVHEGRARDMLKWLFYSTGTLGYNHPTYDVLPYGHGLGLPAGMLGQAFESSCDGMPGADDTLTVVIDKPVKFEEQFRADLILRNAHLVWREGGLRFVSWTTPVAELATVSLDDSWKARPAGNEETSDGRSPSVLDRTMVKNLIKINYNRDITKIAEGGDATYLSPPLVLEDATSVDDHGVHMLTLDAVNVFGDQDAPNQGIRALADNLLAWMPWWSRPIWRVNRSIDVRLSEGFGLADIVAVTDDFVRDNRSGKRRISARPGIVLKHKFNFGGPVAGQGTDNVRPMAGEIDVVFLATDRTFLYAPAAELDETANTGGFTAGYNAATRMLKLKPHDHSLSVETVDIGTFSVNDKVKLVEIDPANPAAPDKWERTITAIDIANNQATLDVALSAPAFNAAKRYRLIFDDYGDTQQTQRRKAFQAGSDQTVAQLAPPNHYGANSIQLPAPVPAIDHTTLPELPANLSYGPNLGAGRDTGYEKELVLLAENLMDHKTARCSPVMGTSLVQNGSINGMVLVELQELFVGNMQPSNGVVRYLTIGPHWATVGGIPSMLARLRVTISGRAPTGPSRTNATFSAPVIARDWTLNTIPGSTGGFNDIEQTIPLSGFANFEFVYVSVECSQGAAFRGFWSFYESERVEV